MFETYVYSRRKIHFVFLSDSLSAPSPDAGDEIRLASRNDVPLLARLYRSERIYHQRFDKGYRAVVCIRNGEAVHMEWFCRGPYYIWDGRVVFDPGPDGYYLFDLYTRPDHRGRGVWRNAVRTVVDAVTHGNRRPALFSAVDYLNERAYKIHLDGGFSSMGLLEFRQLCGFRTWTYAGCGARQPESVRGWAGIHTARLASGDGALRLTHMRR